MILVTLVVATLYAPVRRRVEGVVDRYFKYDDRLFGPYQDDLGRILALVEPRRAAHRLAAEVVAELAATGAAVVDASGVVLATAGSWPVEPVVHVPAIKAPGSDGRIEAVLVGPRRDGRPHDERRLGRVAEVAALAAEAAT